MHIGKTYQCTTTVPNGANANPGRNGINTPDTTRLHVDLLIPAIQALGTVCVEIAAALDEQRRTSGIITRARDKNRIGASINPLDFTDDEDDRPIAA